MRSCHIRAVLISSHLCLWSNLRGDCTCYTGARDLMRSWILLGFANELNAGVSQVHTMQVNISVKVNVTDSTDKENIALIKEALKRLQKACTDTYATTSACRDEVKSKMKELKSKVK